MGEVENEVSEGSHTAREYKGLTEGEAEEAKRVMGGLH